MIALGADSLFEKRKTLSQHESNRLKGMQFLEFSDAADH